MSQEVKVTFSYSYSNNDDKYSSSPSITYSLVSGVLGKAKAVEQTVSSPVALDFSNLSNVRFVTLVNNTTGSVNIAISQGSGFLSGGFATLQSGDFLFLPPTASGLWASGVSGGTGILSVLANEN